MNCQGTVLARGSRDRDLSLVDLFYCDGVALLAEIVSAQECCCDVPGSYGCVDGYGEIVEVGSAFVCGRLACLGCVLRVDEEQCLGC